MLYISVAIEECDHEMSSGQGKKSITIAMKVATRILSIPLAFHPKSLSIQNILYASKDFDKI